MEKIRLGIIGIGNMGSEHCRLILSGQTPEIALTCVADPRQDRRDWAQQTLPAGTGIYADGMSLIRAHACDAVLIATPHELHPPLAEAALRAGLHVLSEKPAGVYTAQLHPVIAAAQETGRTYALMFNQRTNCVYRRLKALLDSGELGALKRVTWVVTDWVSFTGVLRFRGLARNVDGRGRRRAAQPMPASAGFAAMALRTADNGARVLPRGQMARH